MSDLRTTDTTYGEHYFESLDYGDGYRDSTMWEDIAHCIKELYGIDRAAGRDIAGEMNLIDVGCAKGFLVRHLRRRGFDAWGTDISNYALEHAPDDAASYLRWQDISAEADSFFGTERFRVLTCIETLEHIRERQVDTALRSLWKLLKPGGQALLTICVEGQPDTDSDPTHVTIRPRDWWTDRLRFTGFIPEPTLENELRRWWLFSLHKGVFCIRRP